MNILVGFILFGLLVILTPAIRYGLGAIWNVVWVPLLIALVWWALAAEIKDNKARKSFYKTAKNHSMSRNEIVDWLKTKEAPQNASDWSSLQDELDKYKYKEKIKVALLPPMRITRASIKTFINKEEKLIDRLQMLITMKYILTGTRDYINAKDLLAYAEYNFSVLILIWGDDNLYSIEKGLLDKFADTRVIETTEHYKEYNYHTLKLYERLADVDQEILEFIDESIKKLKREVVISYKNEYKHMIKNHKIVISRYAKRFIELVEEEMSLEDSWGDYDKDKLEELEREFLIKIYIAISKDFIDSAFHKDLSSDEIAEFAKEDLKYIDDGIEINSRCPYWMKYLYNVDLPKIITNKIQDKADISSEVF